MATVSFRTRTRARAFTLLELIVVIVVLAVIALIAIPTFNYVMGRSQDHAGQATLDAAGREALALASYDRVGFDDTVIAGLSGDMPAVTFTENSGTHLTEESTSPAKVYYDRTTDRTELGMAVKSKSGRCVYLKLGPASQRQGWIKDGRCDGPTAIAGIGGTPTGGGTTPGGGTGTGVAGQLDTTFAGGVVTYKHPVTNYASKVYQTLVQSDGKVLIRGRASAFTYFPVIARYNVDGTMDTSFGTDGTMMFPDTTTLNDMALQPDGKIVYAFLPNNTSYSNQTGGVGRLNANGTRDTSFGTNGEVSVPVGQISSSDTVVVHSDGTILVAGWTGNADWSNEQVTVFRVTSAGVLDSTYGTGGVTTFLPPGATLTTNTWITRQSDGRAVVSFRATTSTGSWLYAARLTTGGAIDSTYGTNGFVQVAQYWYSYGKIMMQPGNKAILVVVTSTGRGLARLTASGAIDTTFGDAGFWTTPDPYAGEDPEAAVDSAGNIYVAAKVTSGGSDVSRLYRVTSTGQTDTTFGSVTIVPPNPATSVPDGVSVNSSGRVAVSGDDTSDPSFGWLAVVK